MAVSYTHLDVYKRQVLLVAAIPVAMPTVLSVTMAVGARLLAKKQAIVTKLSAIEELAGVDVPVSYTHLDVYKRQAQELNRILHRYFPEERIFRIDHFLGKEPVQNILYTLSLIHISRSRNRVG